jgi:hypothetical protein
VRLSWIPPDLVDQVRDALARGLTSWDELFDSDGVRTGARPEAMAVRADEWPRMAAHVARAERVREVVRRSGLEAAAARFAASPHAIERAALLEAGPTDAHAVAGLLACEIDEYVAYGQFLSQLVELGFPADPAGTVAAFERFVVAASAVVTDEPSWPERLRVARDGLASLYVRVRRFDDAEALYRARFAEEPADTAIAVGAARAFLEAGEATRAVSWLERAAGRAREVGREQLAERLHAKVVTLRARAN